MSSLRWTFPDPRRFFPSLSRSLSSRAVRWARRRQGHDGSATALAARRIYILPSGLGFVYAIMTFVLLLGSMNYNNNLSFLLTFFLIGLGLVAMHQCQRNLVGLDLSFAGMDPVFAGRKAQCRIAARNPSRTARFQLRLNGPNGESETCDLPAGESHVFSLPVHTTTRGWISIERFGASSRFPFDLFRAWAWLHMDIRGLVYPAPADNPPSPPPSESSLGHRQHDARGEEDFAGLRDFHDGDSPRNVAWKAYAKNDQLLTKQFSGSDTSNQWFDFASIESADVEERLRILTRWIIDADRRGDDYGLKLPGADFPPAHGEAHRHACLEALALYGSEEH